jgi:hypothetical protein
MEYETGKDTIDDVDEQHEDESNSITVTGEEWWMKYFGLKEALRWPQEEVNDNTIPQVYKNTPWSSLNVSISGKFYF